jgi:hypothetical protein
MNCTEVKDQLVDLLYDELPAQEQQAIQNHLAGCFSCREDWKNLHAGHSVLNRLPKDDRAPRMEVARLYQIAERRSDRSRRCWQAGAVATGLVAALLLVVAGAQLRFERYPTHFVIAWDHHPQPAPAEPKIADPWPTLGAQHERLQETDQLLKLMAREVLAVESRQSTDLARLQQRLLALETHHDQRWNLTLTEFSRRDRELADVRLSRPNEF